MLCFVSYVYLQFVKEGPRAEMAPGQRWHHPFVVHLVHSKFEPLFRKVIEKLRGHYHQIVHVFVR